MVSDLNTDRSSKMPSIFPGFVPDGGEMGALMRAYDWSVSPLGSPDRWPQSLRSVVQLMLSNRQLMFVAWGPELAFLYNDGYAPTFGAKHPWAFGRPFREVWSEIWDDIAPLVNAALSGEATWSENLHLVMERNGYPEDAWFTFSYSPLRDESGQVAGIFCAGIETTGQVLAERALRESEARFRNMADHAPTMMWVTDAEARCTYLNRAWYDFTGQSAAEAEGFGWLDAVHPDDRGWSGDTFLAANLDRAAFRLEYRLHRADGTYRWAIDAASPRFGPDGEFLGYVGSVVDIHERRGAEDNLRELNVTLERQVADRTRELDRAWRLSQELQVVASQDGTIEAVNARWTELLGWSERELVGTTFAGYVHPDDLDATLTAFGGIIEQPLTVPFAYRFRAEDGSYRWFGWTAAFEHGRVYAVGRDLTAEKEQAAELARAEEQLRQSQKLEAIGQLTGGVAHDFNNLLTVIRGSVDLLRRDDLSEAKRARYIDAIGDTADRAAKLTGQLLAFARRQALSADLFDAGTSLEEVATMLQTMTGSRIMLKLHVPAEPYFIVADRSQFDTAIVNMGINARDAMKGEGRLTIATGPVSGIPPIRADPAVAGDFIAVTIADTGAGITPDQLDRIFEPFFTTKGVGEGTGLGLSQVIGFAKQSGGDVRVDSTPGKGTTFTLYLPRAYPDQVAEPDEADNHAAVTGEGTCVLVVEDNEQVGRFATAALAELGYGSELAIDASQALAALAAGAGRFHIVFSDVVMPGMGGVELGQEVRRLHPDVPVILTSGYSHVLAENGRHGFELLHKPYSIEQLSRVLRKAVTWHSARRWDG